MNNSVYYQNKFKKFIFIFFVLSFLLFNTLSVHAATETLQYSNDNKRQIEHVRYDDGTEVAYIYDTSGNRRSRAVDLQGTANNPPSAPDNQSPSNGASDVALTADLSWTAGSDPDTGDTVVYDIYFGTGSPPPLYRSGYDSTALTAHPLESYTTYYWKIMARDNHGAASEGPEWSFTTIYVPVPPEADPGGLYYGIEGQAITLGASGSSADGNKTITWYEWDIDNDGTYDYSSSLPTQNHTYSQQGTYSIKLRVTDEEDATDEAVTTAIVSDTSPTATFTADVTSGMEPLDVYFADTTMVYDVPPERYWIFGNGGIATTATKQYTYVQNGTFTVLLALKDSDDDVSETSTATIDITVNDSSPAADFTADLTNGSAPLSVNFTNSSTGYDQPLTYEWDFDNDGTTDSTDTEPLYVYDNQGIYTVKLTVTDNDGSINTITRADYISVCYSPVHVTGDPTPYSSLQSAYTAAQNNDTIQSRDMTFTEDLNINRGITITIEGGYDCHHSSNTGQTILKGNMTVSDGTVKTENIVMEE